MPSGAQKLAAQLLDRTAKGLPDWPLAAITAVSATGGTDGQALCTVSYHGASLNLPHFSQYTPVVGHVVVLIRAGGQWIVAGRPIGFP